MAGARLRVILLTLYTLYRISAGNWPLFRSINCRNFWYVMNTNSDLEWSRGMCPIYRRFWFDRFRYSESYLYHSLLSLACCIDRHFWFFHVSVKSCFERSILHYFVRHTFRTTFNFRRICQVPYSYQLSLQKRWQRRQESEPKVWMTKPFWMIPGRQWLCQSCCVCQVTRYPFLYSCWRIVLTWGKHPKNIWFNFENNSLLGSDCLVRNSGHIFSRYYHPMFMFFIFVHRLFVGCTGKHLISASHWPAIYGLSKSRL